jgi:hypothetical protein
MLTRFYNPKAIAGSPRPGGGFVASPRSDLYRDHVRFFGKPDRRDRVRLSKFKQGEWEVQVSTVEKDSKDRAIPEEARDSKIESIIGPAPYSPSRPTSLAPEPDLNPSQPTADEPTWYFNDSEKDSDT